MRPWLKLYPASGLLLLSACVSHPPQSTRQAPADDRRAINVRLTPRGLKEFTTMAKAHQGWVDGLLSDFDAAEADTLIHHLEGLSGRIRNGGSRA